MLLWLDFALFDELPFKIVFRETFEIIRLVTPDNVSKHLYFFFARQIWIWIHSLIHLILKLQKLSLDHLGYVFCYPEYQHFLKPFLKIRLALKVLQVLLRKIIVWKQKSTVVKFTRVKNRGKFTTGNNFYHGVCNRTSSSEEKQKALKPGSKGKYGIFIIMGFYSWGFTVNKLSRSGLFNRAKVDKLSVNYYYW